MELYRKIYIKSEDDLPKEVGNYFVCLTNGHARFLHFPFKNDLGYDVFKMDWMKDVDYYLQPIEITDADIKAWAMESSYTKNSWRHKALIEGAKAMRDGEIKHIEK